MQLAEGRGQGNGPRIGSRGVERVRVAELKRLRKENAELKMDREILLKASVFFAKETNR